VTAGGAWSRWNRATSTRWSRARSARASLCPRSAPARGPGWCLSVPAAAGTDPSRLLPPPHAPPHAQESMQRTMRMCSVVGVILCVCVVLASVLLWDNMGLPFSPCRATALPPPTPVPFCFCPLDSTAYRATHMHPRATTHPFARQGLEHGRGTPCALQHKCEAGPRCKWGGEPGGART